MAPSSIAVVLAVALLQAAFDEVGRLHEALPRLTHVDAQQLELDATGTAPEAHGEEAVAVVVEHRDLLGDTGRTTVPGDHHHHRAELERLAGARHVAQELEHVGAHLRGSASRASRISSR